MIDFRSRLPTASNLFLVRYNSMIVEVASQNVADAQVRLESPTDKKAPQIYGISGKGAWWLSLPKSFRQSGKHQAEQVC
jgi:hypothetical protein